MKTTLNTYTIREITDGFVYSTSEERGLYGLAGELTIQPEYQRNYLYGEKGRDADVIDSILAGYPLGLLYFARNDSGGLEILDGQQRVTSVGRFTTGKFAIDIDGEPHFFANLDAEAQKSILDYELLVWEVEGTESEIKDWFRTVNIAGIELNDQELLNAIYSGPFVTAAKAVLSDPRSAETKRRGDYVKGSAKRQNFLTAALKWVSADDVSDYMARHRDDADAEELIAYFDDVLNWVATVFVDIYPEMRGIDWGELYREYGGEPYNSTELAAKVADLYADEDVQSNKGIWKYLLGGEEDTRLLTVRVFDRHTKAAVYRRQTDEAKAKGVSNCPLCALGANANATRIYPASGMEADHVAAWSKGGATDEDNCEMLCKTHNGAKGNK